MTEVSATTAADKLSAKQREVLDRLARGQLIKTIADEMNVSETRINQHIRAIKDRLGVNDKEDLIASWLGSDPADPLRKPLFRKPQLPDPDRIREDGPAVDTAIFRFEDAGVVALKLPWDNPEFGRVGRGRLDGPGAAAKRIGFIILVAIGLPVAVVLTLSAMIALTAMLRTLQ